MTIAMAITIGALLLLLFGVIVLRAPLDISMVSILALLMLAGVIDPIDAFAGFSNPAVLMIAALYVVATGMRETGAINRMVSVFMGRPRSTRSALFSITAPVAGLSGFMNNTPLVAMFMPAVVDMARRIRASPSKLLMPLSFASILGGQLTIVGTASNLVVNGMYGDWLQLQAESHALTGEILPRSVGPHWRESILCPWKLRLVAAILGVAFLIIASPCCFQTESRNKLLPPNTPDTKATCSWKQAGQSPARPSKPLGYGIFPVSFLHRSNVMATSLQPLVLMRSCRLGTCLVSLVTLKASGTCTKCPV